MSSRITFSRRCSWFGGLACLFGLAVWVSSGVRLAHADELFPPLDSAFGASGLTVPSARPTERFPERPIEERELLRFRSWTPSRLDSGTKPAGSWDFPAWDDFSIPDDRDQPAPVNQVDPDAERVLRLTARYLDPKSVRFVRTLSYERAQQLFAEISRLIDTRHMEPASYAERSAYAIGNLERALNIDSFLTAAGVSRTRVGAGIESELARLRAESRGIRDLSGAQMMMRRVMDLLYQQTGLHPSFVAHEFVYGSAEALDRYSSFEPDVPAGGDSASLDEHVVGIGVEIKLHDEGAEVVRPLRNSPAARAGLLPGDLITAIDGRPLAGLSIAQVADLIGGPAGSTLALQIKRDGRSYRAGLTRARVEILSVSDVKMLDQSAGVGYIRLDKFASTSEKEVDEALWSLHRQGMRSLVFDVRGNPGGLLTTAIALSDKFLPCGQIVSTRGRLQSDNSSTSAKRSQTWKVPLVVLIDGESASASEIFAAAVQENGRGVVVGRRSYGKGTVQTHFPLQTVSGTLRLTTANFYSPGGRKMAGEGVVPDVTTPLVSERSAADQDRIDLSEAMRIATSSRVTSLAETAGQCRQPQPSWLLGQNGR